MAPIEKGEPGYENRFRNRPISGGRDLPCFRPEWLPELHSPSPAGGIAGQFMGALYASHYLRVIFTFQVVAAVLLLANRHVPLAVAVLAPVIVNIFVFHALMAPSGLPLALFVAVLWAVIFVDVRQLLPGCSSRARRRKSEEGRHRKTAPC
jgi:putative oxidoreductase